MSCDNPYGEGIFATIETNRGDIVVQLYFDKTPVTVANFVSLSEGDNPRVNEIYQNKPFYDGIIFHRVINDFMIQAGDPNGSGQGGPGYKFEDEIVESLKHDSAGILSMANSGAATNGSQFFITHKATPWLDGRHTVFGKVLEGQNVVDSIRQNDTIFHVKIKRSGKEARQFKAKQVFDDSFLEAEEKKNKIELLKKETAAVHASLKAEATTTESGLKYTITSQGQGEAVSEDKKINTHYAVYFEDGALLDTSVLEIAKSYDMVNPRRPYNPLTAQVGPEARMIEGFKEGLKLLNVGDKATLFLPYDLAYGAQGGGAIPPESNLIFEVEIVSQE